MSVMGTDRLGPAPVTNDERSFVRLAGVAALLSAPLAVANLVAMLATVHFDVRGMTDPLVLLHAGSAAAPLWRLSMVLDILGYYLLIVPLLLVFHARLRLRSPRWSDLSVLCLLAYCVIGAIGGAVLATALPTLIREFASSSAATSHATLQTVFTGYTDGVYRGMWNLLEEFLAGVGWFVLGTLLRDDHRRLGTATLVLGAACLVDSMGTALGVEAIASVGLTIYLALAPLWAAWTGAILLTGSRWSDAVSVPEPRSVPLISAGVLRREGL
jgi:hypothetical protein